MRRPTIFVVLAGLAALLASVVVYRALKSREAELASAMARTTQIVVANKDLPLGTKLQASDLKMARWSAESMPAGAFTEQGPALDHFVKNQFVANEPIVPSKLFMGEKTAGVLPLLIPIGMRAVSVAVDEVSDIAGFVLPRTRVDVVVAVSGGGGTNEPFSKVVLQNVEVLAVAQEVELEKDEPKVVKVVTLLVTPQEAERLALASREGALRLAMRNFQDDKIVLTSGADVKALLKAYSSAPAPIMKAQGGGPVAAPRVRPFEVEIMRDGKSSESISFISEAAVSRSKSSAKGKAPNGAAGAKQETPPDGATAGSPGASDGAAIASAPAALTASPAAAIAAMTARPAAASAPITASPSGGTVVDATQFLTHGGASHMAKPTPKVIDVP
ncbi:MAG: Flp pilus assembly protein CpaB [Candidatus Binataceae bacterium]